MDLPDEVGREMVLVKNIQIIKSEFKVFNANLELNTHTNFYRSKNMSKLGRNSTSTKNPLLNERLSEKSVLRVYRSAKEA